MWKSILTAGEGLEMHRLTQIHAREIFTTIDTQREYLRVWLPFVDYTLSAEDIEQFIAGAEKRFEETGEFNATIYYHNQFAGLAGFKDIDTANQRTEIGYWLSPSFQGKGIMTRCCKRLIDYAFTEYNMNRIQLKIAVGNTKSQRVAQRLGFVHEGTERDGERLVSGFTDLMVFSLLKREWEAGNQ